MTQVQLNYLGPLKLLLLLGVVLVHCNIAAGGAPYANAGLALVDCIPGDLALACVPSFFILSGYLYFRGVDKLSGAIYAGKLRRRVKTLVVPYLVWNLLCALLLYVKVRFMGNDGLGIIAADGRIDWLRFLEGFWMIPQLDGAPFAFAFWFIRNLICLVVVSPLFYAVGRSRLLTALVIAVSIAVDKSFFGAEYFVVGACLALHRFELRRLRMGALPLAVLAAVYVAAAAAIYWKLNEDMYLTLRYILVFSGFTVFVNAALRLSGPASTPAGVVMVGATFWIYALHQCFCTLVCKLWVSTVGDGRWFTALASYALSFLTLVGVSVGTWLIMRRVAPRVLAILTGNR